MEPESKPQLRVATWNIRAGLGTDLRRDAQRVLDAIAALRADILALQEADFRLGARPSALPRDEITERTGLLPLPVGRNSASIGWHGNALLVRPDFRLVGLERLDLPGIEPRGAVIADLDGPGALRLVGVHLGLWRGSRRKQLDTIREAVLRHPARPTLILGDFNEYSRRVGLGRLTRAFRLMDPAPTYPSRRPTLALDRIAHSHDLELEPLAVPWRQGVQVSDHLPLLAQMRWL
ncbi:endonuclease/exonuclease/phosphatase family protein [Tabrizicola sp. YIM 78059]|uniref:endonuclease/exonuclease/phosphatase family protein n=1 Tax=Tabrizicola sp. YIM 78059 TaxID=2529861 RepID=UPI0010AAA34F|nr:endonuclease/exonuclease/phosphatase family protein [Tabrizicola sp. YIM 78059]